LSPQSAKKLKIDLPFDPNFIAWYLGKYLSNQAYFSKCVDYDRLWWCIAILCKSSTNRAITILLIIKLNIYLSILFIFLFIFFIYLISTFDHCSNNHSRG
jgi:hypothetical protein